MTKQGRLDWHIMRMKQGKPSEYADEFSDVTLESLNKVEKEVKPKEKEKEKNDNR